MKLSTAITLVFILPCLTSCDREKVVHAPELPSQIKSYVSTHFPNCSISATVKENNENDELYEVSLSCGCKLEFDKQNNITDIDCASKLPDSVIPNNILSYVHTNFSGNYIIGWEIEDINQNVELNNHLTLVFNMQGDFLRIDN